MHGKAEDGGNYDNDGAYEDDGERIGPYQNCQYIASGVTAEVFRCKDLALKVIVEAHIEPHDPFREAKILEQLKEPCIPLLDTFRDHEQRFTLVFPYMPLTLSDLLERGSISDAQVRRIFGDLFQALAHIHGKGIIHRDIKPQAILLASPDGPAYLSDFGTAWHPELSASNEPANAKILDIGTGPYRAPEVLFGDKSYGTAVDIWGAGCMLAECVRQPPKTLFESRAAHEDGNQLGLILSIFRTLGTPTRESWPEATCFKTPPFDIYRVFEGRPWDDILNGVDDEWKGLIKAMVRYDSGRMKAEQALLYVHELLEKELLDRKLVALTRLDRVGSRETPPEASNISEILFDVDDLEPLGSFLVTRDQFGNVHGSLVGERIDTMAKMAYAWIDGDRSAARHRTESKSRSSKLQIPRKAAVEARNEAGEDGGLHPEDQCVADMIQLEAEMDEFDLVDDGKSFSDMESTISSVDSPSPLLGGLRLGEAEVDEASVDRTNEVVGSATMANTEAGTRKGWLRWFAQ
ncbi:Serine/threonine-protein kinase csk1 [Cytospora mali]|uniref:cyclin-dependent kinase n=1 Tax=Cytospora mali TaxID=578113 RepID=A0A194UW51_CYTMA|nr:Serine/threonine-protein kinase csk1 [Valsa mali var. pyri (nom. inval.)]